MVLKNLAQLFVVGAQVVGRAFTKAFQEELSASRQAAERHRANAQSSSSSGSKSSSSWHASADSLQGITVQEAKQILNVSEINKEAILKNYEHLFGANDKSKGGSLYLQSKVVRAKERLDYEISLMEKGNEKPPQQEPPKQGSDSKQP